MQCGSFDSGIVERWACISYVRATTPKKTDGLVFLAPRSFFKRRYYNYNANPVAQGCDFTLTRLEQHQVFFLRPYVLLLAFQLRYDFRRDIVTN